MPGSVLQAAALPPVQHRHLPEGRGGEPPPAAADLHVPGRG